MPHEELRDRSPSILGPEGIEGMRVVCKVRRWQIGGDSADGSARARGARHRGGSDQARDQCVADSVSPLNATATNEIDAIVHQACIDRDSYPAPLNYRYAAAVVGECSSPKELPEERMHVRRSPSQPHLTTQLGQRGHLPRHS